MRDLPRPDTSIIKASIYVDDAVMDMAYILEREMGEDFVFAPSGAPGCRPYPCLLYTSRCV